MNNSSETKDRRERWELFGYYEVYYIWSGIVLFESAFGLLHIKNSNKTNLKNQNMNYSWWTRKGDKVESYKMLI